MASSSTSSWTPPTDAVEAQAPVTSSKGWAPPTDAVEATSSSPSEPPKTSAGKQFLAGAASAADFPLSLPGFVAATGAELATTTGSMLASPFTGESSKQAYGRGARVGSAVGEALMNPMQKLMNMFGEAEAYTNAPLPQAMSWFGEKLQVGGKKLEEATGIPSEAVPLMANVGMITGTGGIGKAAIAKGKEMLKPSETKPTTQAVGIPPKPKEGATPEEKAKFLEDAKAEVAKRDAKSPIVETAIRNKETGNVERMGPKHDEARKAETVDTHDQGFVTERGKFLTRQEAVDHAKGTEQLPQDHTLERPEEGLHSGDLRTAGDERFKVTEEQPAGVPKKDIPIVEPKTRAEFKEELDMVEERLGINLEVDKIDAEKSGDKAAIEAIYKEEADLEARRQHLIKNMPEVEFKNKVKPTWEETHDFLYGTKNMGEAIDKLLGAGVGGQRFTSLAKALNTSEFIRSAGLTFSNDAIQWQGCLWVIHGRHPAPR
jgi:hypothetical protein